MSELLYGFWDFLVHQWGIASEKHENLVKIFMTRRRIRAMSWFVIYFYGLVFALPDNGASYFLLFVLTATFFLAVSLVISSDSKQRLSKREDG